MFAVRRAALAASLFIALPTAAHAAPEDTLSLAAVWSDVVATNPDVLARRQRERAAEVRVSATGTWDDPMLMLGAMNVPTSLQFDMDPMTMKAIGLSQTIPLGGSRGLERRAAREDVLEARAVTAAARADRLADAYAAFANLWTARSLRRVLQDRASTLDRIVRMTEARVSAGTGAVEDAWRARAERARLIEDTALLDREEVVAAAALNSVRGRDPSAVIGTIGDVPDPPLADDASAWSASLADESPALRTLDARAAAYDTRAAAAGRRVIPDISVSLTYGRRDRLADGTLQDNMWTAEIAAALPLFAGRTRSAAAREMRALSQATRLERGAAQIAATRDLVALHAEARRARTTANAYAQDVIPLDTRAADAALAGYASGATDFTRAFDAALALSRDRVAWTRARQAYALALADALRWIGSPARLGLPTSSATER